MALELPTKSTWHPTDTGGTVIETSAGDVIDNIWVYASASSPTGKVRRVADGDYRASWAGLFGVSDKAVQFQAVMNDANIPTLVVDKPFVCNGAVNGGGKTLKFRPGGMITGAFSISNAVIEAPSNIQIFSTSGLLSGCQTSQFMPSVKWAGAVGNNAVDDKPAIQWMMDMVIRNAAMCRDLFFPRPSVCYRCDSPLIAYNWNGSNYDFFSLNMIGESSMSHFTPLAYVTQIRFTDPNTFGIGYQRARASVIKGLYIQGPLNRNFGTAAAQFRAPYSTFASAGGVRDNRYSPLQGVAIDPFMNFDDPTQVWLSFADRYQTLLSWYRGSGTRGGSSAVNVSDCRINGFTVGIGYSVNGMTLNAENCLIEKCCVEMCKAAFAYGQAQIKDNYIRNTIHWDRVHTVVDAATYGSLSGLRPTQAYMDGLNIAGAVNRLFYVANNFPAKAENIFSEQLLGIGYCGGGSAFSITDSTFNFVDEVSGENLSPGYHFYGLQVTFKTCDFRVFDDLFNKKMIIRGDRISFENCKFDTTPLEQIPNYMVHTIEYKNCFLGSGELMGWEYSNTPAGALGIHSVRTRGKCTYNLFRGGAAVPLGADGKTEFQSDKMDDFMAISGNYAPSFTKNANGTLTMQLAAGSSGWLVPGDYLIEGENSLVNFYDEYTGAKDSHPVYGKVLSVNYGTDVVILDYVPNHITSGTNAYPWRVKKVNHALPYAGNTPASGVVWTRMMFPAGISMLSSYTGYPVDTVNHTMTLGSHYWGGVAQDDFIWGDNSNFRQLFIHDSETPFTLSYAAGFARPVLRNTLWKTKQVFGGEQIERTYVCTRSGYLDAITLGYPSDFQAEWAMLPVLRQEAGVLTFYNFVTDAWENVAGSDFVNPMTTLNDLIVGGVAGSPTRMGIGPALHVLRVNSAGNGYEFAASAGGMGGSGTTNKLSRFSGSTTLADSAIGDNGTYVTVDTGMFVQHQLSVDRSTGGWPLRLNFTQFLADICGWTYNNDTGEFQEYMAASIIKTWYMNGVLQMRLNAGAMNDGTGAAKYVTSTNGVLGLAGAQQTRTVEPASDYTVNILDRLVLVNTAGGDVITAIIFSVFPDEHEVIIMKGTADANIVRIAPDFGDINGVLEKTLAFQYEYIHVKRVGVKLFVIG